MNVASRIFTGALLLASPCAFAQGTAIGTSNVSVNVISPIGITNSAPLNFGDVASPSGAATVTVDTSGVRTASATLLSVNSANTPTAAHFTVTGQPGKTYGILLPSSTSLTSGSNPSINVNGFNSNPAATGTGTLTGTGNNGSQELYVGATLNLNSGQPAAIYSGTFQVTVTYN